MTSMHFCCFWLYYHKCREGSEVIALSCSVDSFPVCVSCRGVWGEERKCVYLSCVKLKLSWILLSVSIKRLDSTLILCKRNQLCPPRMMGKWASERWPVHPPSSQITLTPCSSFRRPAVCTNNSRHVYPLAHRVAHTEPTEQHTRLDVFTAQEWTCTQFTKIPKAAQCLDPSQKEVQKGGIKDLSLFFWSHFVKAKNLSLSNKP